MNRPALDELRQMAGEFARPGSTRSDIWSAADVMALALRAMQESETVIARLKAELDSVQNRSVLHCMDRDLPAVISASPASPAGAIIRTTDTGREFEARDGSWLELAAG